MCPEVIEKRNLIQLSQSSSRDAIIVSVNSGSDDGIRTGPMGDCVSVVLLYGKSHTPGLWVNMRGHHGSGGDVAWDKLVWGIGITPQVKCVIISYFFNETTMSRWKDELAKRKIVDYSIHKSGDAIVFKTGAVRDWQPRDAKIYNVRRSDSFGSQSQSGPPPPRLPPRPTPPPTGRALPPPRLPPR